MKRSMPILMLVLLCVFDHSFAETTSIRLTLGDSKLIHVEASKKVAIEDPLIANVTAVGDDEILVSARSPGSTRLIYISSTGQRENSPIIVSPHHLKKPMIEIGVEIMEIDSQSALKAGLSWGSIAPAS